MRNGWVPRKLEDFGEGGAFPEIHIPQFPLDMGMVEETSNALVIHNNADEDSKTEMILKQGHDKDRIIFGRPEDAREKDMVDKPKISEEERAQRIDEVKAAFNQQLDKQIYDSKVVKKSHPKPQTDFVLYTPAQKGPLFNNGNQQRIIKMVEVQIDPMEPPKFQINKKIPRGPPSPPAAILSSPPRPPTKREKAMWKVPPCVSNWKNPRGYTVPLSNRVAADGRNNQVTMTNEKINAFSEALFIAERKSREEISMRNLLRQKIKEKDKDKSDAKLRQLALRAREKQNMMQDEDNLEAQKRDEIRHDRQKTRNRERNMNKAGPDVRRKALEDRDISEQIALGQANPLLNKLKDDNVYDQRLMDKTGGLDSGFAAGADDLYNIYDKPLFNQNKTVYKAPRQNDTSTIEDVETYQKGSKKFQSERDGREAPVAYEKDDPFELNMFLSQVKGTKRPADDVRQPPPAAGAAGSKKKK